MKFLAALMTTAGLILGAVSASTAYVPTLERAALSDEPLTLNSDAGKPVLLKSGSKLTKENLEKLKAASIRRVNVKEFHLSRWTHRFEFLLAVLLLAGGATVFRLHARTTLEQALQSSSGQNLTPRKCIQLALEKLHSLSERIEKVGPAKSTPLIIETLDEVRAAALDPFVDARARLVGSMGMAGYAQLMDRFSAAERQLNRAWSAAADGVFEESIHCLSEGEKLLSDTLELCNS